MRSPSERLNPQQACHEILSIDKQILFAGMSNSTGTATYHEYRHDITPMLSLDETNKSMLQAVIREGMRTTLEGRLGECKYAFALYKKVKRITIPLRPPTMKGGSHGIAMISIELAADHESVLAKVLPFLERMQLDH